MACGNKSWAPGAIGPSLFEKKKPVMDVDDDLEEGTRDSDEGTENDNVEDNFRSGNESRSPSKTTSSKIRKSLDAGVTSNKKCMKDIDACMDILRSNIKLGTAESQPPPSMYGRMISILEFGRNARS